MSETAPFVDSRVTAIAPAVSVQLAIEPDERLTTEWLRRLIAEARRAAECKQAA